MEQFFVDMQKKWNTNSVLIKNKYNVIKKPNEEANTPSKYTHAKILDKNKTQLTLAFDFNELGNLSNANNSQQKKSDKSTLLNKLKNLKFEFQKNTETKMRLVNEVNSAKNKANKQFLQNEDRYELQKGFKKLTQDLNQMQNKYKNNLKFLKEMRYELDSLRTERFRNKLHPFPNENLKTKVYLPEVDSIQNPIISELNQRSNDLFQKIDGLQEIMLNILESTHKPNIFEVFYEAEQLERENKEMAQYLFQYERLIPQLMIKHNKLKALNNDLHIERQKKAEKQKLQLTEISNEVSQLQCHLNEIESQKNNDKGAFFDVFLEIEQLYTLLGCDINLLTSNDNIHSLKKESSSTLITHHNVMNALLIIESTVQSIVQSRHNT